MSIVGLWSGKNYLKHANMGTVSMSKPGILAGALYTSTYVVVHNLGYEPLVRAAFDGDNDGTIYPAVDQRGNAGAQAAIFGAPFGLFIDDITTTTVTFRAEWGTALAGTFPLYYRIYIDPTL